MLNIKMPTERKQMTIQKRYLINLSYDDSIIFDHKTAEEAVNSDRYAIHIS